MGRGPAPVSGQCQVTGDVVGEPGSKGIDPTFHHTVPQLGMQKLLHNLTEMTYNMTEA